MKFSFLNGGEKVQSIIKAKTISVAIVSGISLLLLMVCCGPSLRHEGTKVASLSNVTLRVDGMKKVNTEFNNFFTTLFGGGHASLEVMEIKKRKISIDLGDIEEAAFFEGEPRPDESGREGESSEFGIDIKVNLPRKKIKGLEMLSGGERALTSIALLFAYIGHQIKNKEMVQKGLSLMAETNPDDKLLILLKSVWLVDEDSSQPEK